MSPCAATTEARTLESQQAKAPEAEVPRMCTLQWEARALQLDSSPCSPQMHDKDPDAKNKERKFSM